MSNHVFALRDRARAWGYASEAYAIEAKPGVEDTVLPYRRLFRTVQPDDLLLLHYSIGNEVFAQLAKLPCRKVLVYHNVTPPEFFSGINPHAAAFARLGRDQLASLAPNVELAIGVSEFNRRELELAGFTNTITVPILIDWSALAVAPDPGVRAAWDGAAPKLLFVGRISPNKRQDELIRALAYYRRCIDPDATLLLVGSFRDQPQYHQRLRALATSLGLDGAVVVTGPVGLAQLVAYYSVGSVYLSLSEHEGFGVPLLEAMHLGTPVVALDTSAVGETVGSGGILLPKKDLALAAETCGVVVERSALRASLVAAGHRRAEEFAADIVAERTRAALGL